MKVGVRLMADVSRFQRNMRLAQTETGFTVRNFGRMSDAMMKNGVSASVLGSAFHVLSGALRAVAIAGGAAVAVLATFAAKTTAAFGDYEEKMARVRAVTSGSAKDFAHLRKTIDKTAIAMKTSSTEMASGAEFLGMAGFSAAESASLLGNVTNLAQIGLMDLGDAADITTNVVAGLGIEYENSAELGQKFGRVADVIAKTMSSSNTNLRQFGDAFKYVMSVLSDGEGQFTDAAAAIGLLANAGLQGEMGGTALRNMMLRLKTPTAKTRRAIKLFGLDVDKMKGSFVGLIEEIERVDMSEDNIAEIFGARALPGVMKLLKGVSKAIQRFKDALEDSEGVAQAMGEVMRNTLNAQLRELEEHFRQISRVAGGEFAIAIRAAIDYFGKLAKSTDFTKDKFRLLVRGGILYFVEGLAKVVIGAGVVLHWTSMLIDGFRTFGFTLEVVMSGALGFMKLLASGVITIVEQVQYGLYQLNKWYYKNGKITKKELDDSKKAWEGLSKAAEDMKMSASDSFREARKTFDEFDPYKYTKWGEATAKGADKAAVHLLRFRKHLIKTQQDADKAQETYENFMAGFGGGKGGTWTGNNHKDLTGDSGDDKASARKKKGKAIAEMFKRIGDAAEKASKPVSQLQFELWAIETKHWGYGMDEFYPKMKEGLEDGITAAEKMQVALEGINSAMGLFGTTGIGELMSQELERLNYEKRQSFLEAKEAEIEAQERLNQSIINQVAALDQVQAKIGQVADKNVSAVAAYASAEEGVEKMRAELNLMATAMGAIGDIGPAVFKAMGMSARQQAVAQIVLNSAMAFFALGMGFMKAAAGDPRAPGYFAAAAAFGGKAIAGGIGLNKMGELKPTAQAPGSDTDNDRGSDYSVTREAIVQALKEAGLYQLGWEELLIQNYGTTPVAFEKGKSARQARAIEKQTQLAERIRG